MNHINSTNTGWSRFKFPDTVIKWSIYMLILVFIWFSLIYLNIHLGRSLTMFGRIWHLLYFRYYPPRISHVLSRGYLWSIVETIQMAFLGTLIGTVLAIPFSWFASFNVTPNKKILYPLGRGVIIASRSVHEMIWTIIFVIILGYGMLPGAIALTLRTLGFSGKLFAEEIEAIDRGQVEAIQATGANPLQLLCFAVLPQVKVAWTGITIYAWDSAFRAATVVGFFGAGGMGWYLRRAVDQIQYHRVAAILLSIIILVVVSEITSAWARSKVASQTS